MARIPLASSENLTPEQQRVYDSIVSTRGGRLTAPYQLTLLHSPLVTDKWQQLGGVLRNNIGLPPRLAELSIGVTAHCRDCSYVWQAHARLALAEGVSAETLEGIKAGRSLRSPMNKPSMIFARSCAAPTRSRLAPMVACSSCSARPGRWNSRRWRVTTPW